MGGGNGRPDGGGFYGKTRVRLAVLFGGAAVALALLDAIPGIDVDAIALGVLVGAALALVGLEAGPFVGRK